MEDQRLQKDPTDDQTKDELHTAAEDSGPEPAQENDPPLPQVNFSSFVLSISSSALFHFGEIPDPVTNQKQRNLSMAKQTIDILGILEEKTSGNLTKEESALLENLLYDLRLRYVNETTKT